MDGWMNTLTNDRMDRQMNSQTDGKTKIVYLEKGCKYRLQYLYKVYYFLSSSCWLLCTWKTFSDEAIIAHHFLISTKFSQLAIQFIINNFEKRVSSVELVCLCSSFLFLFILLNANLKYFRRHFTHRNIFFLNFCMHHSVYNCFYMCHTYIILHHFNC